MTLNAMILLGDSRTQETQYVRVDVLLLNCDQPRRTNRDESVRHDGSQCLLGACPAGLDGPGAHSLRRGGIGKREPFDFRELEGHALLLP